MKRPVSLRVLEARNNCVKLQWESDSIDVHAFLVEWSKDKRIFSPIGTVDGKANTSGKLLRYHYNDTLPTSGNSWYRIKMLEPRVEYMAESAPTRAVKVTIEGPGAGDLDDK